MMYSQENQSHVKGGLTAKVPQPDHVKQMMLIEAAKKQSSLYHFKRL